MAKIPSAKPQRCVRGNVYRDAEEFLAFRLDDVNSNYIWYDGNDLHIDLYFKSEEKAMQFQTNLRQWNFKRPYFPIEQPDVEPLQVTGPHPLVPVLLNQYEGKDSSSPCMSLEDLRGSPSARASSIEPDTDLGKYQALERPEWLQLGGAKPYRLHLKNQGPAYRHDPSLASDDNNMLAGSWPFHQFVDGLNMPDKLPIIALKPGDIMEEIEVEGGQKRRKVMVDLECRDENTVEAVFTMLKPGSTRTGPLAFSTFVLVKDPSMFKDCLQWKYDDTKRKWKAVQDALDAEQ